MTRPEPVAPSDAGVAHHELYMIVYLPMLLYFAIAEEWIAWRRRRRPPGPEVAPRPVSRPG